MNRYEKSFMLKTNMDYSSKIWGICLLCKLNSLGKESLDQIIDETKN